MKLGEITATSKEGKVSKKQQEQPKNAARGARRLNTHRCKGCQANIEKRCSAAWEVSQTQMGNQHLKESSGKMGEALQSAT